jgi:hypothetical protein
LRAADATFDAEEISAVIACEASCRRDAVDVGVEALQPSDGTRALPRGRYGIMEGL